jgi:hypothetical protein
LELLQKTLARIAVATSGMLCAALQAEAAVHHVTATTRAAREYALHPTEENDNAFFEAATDSFPFGPGDGCLAVEELGGHETRGAGCGSGAGFIWYVAQQIGMGRARAAIVRDVVPWLEGTGDPLAEGTLAKEARRTRS